MIVKQSPLTKALYILLLLIFASSLIFSIYYFTTGRETLTRWFFNLDNCFYRKDHWSSEFFTPHVKEQGNRWCALAIGISLVGTIFIARAWKRPSTSAQHLQILWPGKLFILPSIVVVSGISLWAYSFSLSSPAYDEIFSAVYGATGHPLQTLAYYMLPNNHILFNVVNNLLFHPFDKIISGRVISLLAYLGVLLAVFYWFKNLNCGSVNAFFATLLIAVQFPVLGFSSQARGYEMQLLAGWIAFISLFKYYENNKNGWLKWHCFACIIGYATIPSFMYFHVAILTFSSLYQLYNRKLDLSFWKYHLICCSMLILFYLPAFCFSGFSSFSDNPTVKASEETIPQFLHLLSDKLLYFVSFCFSSLFGEYNIINYLLFFLPLALICFKNRLYRMMGVFYLLVWVMFILLVVYFKKIPFSRTLIIQYSVTQFMVVFTLFSVIRFLARRSHLNMQAIFPLVSLLLIGHYLFRYQKDSGHILYFNAVNEIYDSYAFAETLPRTGTIGFSDESFYLFYRCLKRKYEVSQCPQGEEMFYIKLKSEPLPPSLATNYVLLQSLPNDHELYRRRTSDSNIIQAR
jgi:hypothetical protein